MNLQLRNSLTKQRLRAAERYFCDTGHTSENSRRDFIAESRIEHCREKRGNPLSSPTSAAFGDREEILPDLIRIFEGA